MLRYVMKNDNVFPCRNRNALYGDKFGFDMSRTMSKLLASCLPLFGAAFGHATCQLSAEPHPRGAIGLHLFYPDDPRSRRWADELHAPWLRIELRWDWIQPLEGMFDAEYADRVMQLTGIRQQKIIVVLFNRYVDTAPG